jgi:hypothetical protein
VTTSSLTVHVGGQPVKLRAVTVSRGFTNTYAPLTCGHQHKAGDTIWTRADLLRPTVLLCDPCAQFDARRDT